MIERESHESSKIRAHEISVALRNSLRLGGSLLATWSVALIVKFQVPAYLGPTRHGHFGFAESFAAMFFAVLGLGVDVYITKEVAVRPQHASDFVGGVFVVRILLSIVLFAAMLLTLHTLHRPAEILPAAAVFGVAQFLICLNSTYASVLQATSHVGGLAVTNVLAKLVWGAGLMVGLRYNASLFVLAMPMLLAEVLRAIFLAWAARGAADLRLRVDLQSARAVLLASVPFFVNMMAVIVVNNLALSTLEFIRRDDREVGWFAAAQNLASLAMLLQPLLGWVVMPMLSRAQARSPEEMTVILRRALEGLIVVIAPITTLISAGSAIFVRIAFGERYAPAAAGLSILSLVFVMVYMNILGATALILSGKSWWVTCISVASIFVLVVFMLVFVPIGRALLGTGGECAGAAFATIGCEGCVNIAMLWSFRHALGSPPLDRRAVHVLVKSVAISVGVLLVDRKLLALGPTRLLIDLGLYVVAALALRVVRPSEVLGVVKLLRARRRSAGADTPTST